MGNAKSEKEQGLCLLLGGGEAYDLLTKSEKRIVDYVTSNPEKAVNASIGQMATECHLSQATIIRYCRKLGLTGYQEFKIRIAQSLAMPLGNVETGISKSDSEKEIIQKVFAAADRTLHYTIEAINFNSLIEAAEILGSAKRIIVTGFGNSHATALDLQHKLMRLGFDAVAYQDNHLLVIAVSAAGPEDVLIAVSRSGETKEVLFGAQIALRNKAKVIAITGVGINALSRIADIVLSTATKEEELKVLARNSHLSEMLISDALYTLLVMKRRKEVEEHFEVLDEWLDKMK